MPVFRDKEDVYDRCSADGSIIPQEKLDKGKIESNLNIAEEDILSAGDLAAKKRWNSCYKIYYDALHILVETLISQCRVLSQTSKHTFKQARKIVQFLLRTYFVLVGMSPFKKFFNIFKKSNPTPPY